MPFSKKSFYADKTDKILISDVHTRAETFGDGRAFKYYFVKIASFDPNIIFLFPHLRLDHTIDETTPEPGFIKAFGKHLKRLMESKDLTQDGLKYLGFSEGLSNKLAEELASGKTEFQMRTENGYGWDRVSYTLDFGKSDSSDMFCHPFINDLLDNYLRPFSKRIIEFERNFMNGYYGRHKVSEILSFTMVLEMTKL